MSFSHSDVQTIKRGNEEVGSLIDRVGAEAVNHNGDTLLHAAASSNAVHACLLLIAKGASLTARNKAGQRPIDVAQGETRQLLLGATLLQALADGNSRLVYEVIRAGADVNATDKNGNTPLHIAVLKDNGNAAAKEMEMVQLLIEQHANVNAQNEEGETPLHNATIAERGDLIQLLIVNGADSGLANYRGELPFDMAGNLSAEILELLLPAETPMAAMDNDDTFVDELRRLLPGEEGRAKVQRIPLPSNGQKEEPDILSQSNGLNDLFKAARENNVEKARQALENGAGVTETRNNGETALHEAARYGSLGVLRLLIGLGADVNARAADEKTPLHVAAENNKEAAAVELVENGAKRNLLARGRSPAQLAKRKVAEAIENARFGNSRFIEMKRSVQNGSKQQRAKVPA